MNFGSVCSGIEAASVAFSPLGWRAAWFSEIEPFPAAVLAHHYPEVPNLGDMTAIARRVLMDEIEAPDMLCGGTPCQAFSVAGLRESLDDARGNLTLKFVELADAIDHVRVSRGDDPAIIFWENVPGVLSTKDNAFGCFLAGLAGEDEPLEPAGEKWTNAGCVYGPARAVAWRTLDAQYFGLAQRRRRVFVVASARDGFDPATVLFEWDGMRRDSAPSREAGEETAGGFARSVALRGREGGGAAELGDDLQNCLRASGGGGDKPHVIVMAHGQGGAEVASERRTTLTCNHEAPIVARCVTGDVTHTLKAEGFDASEGGTGRGQPIVVHGTQDPCVSTETAFALGRNNGGENAVAFAENSRAEVRLEGGDGQRTGAISTGGGNPGQGVPMVATTTQVRRLTPRECERLMGFPDDYTLIPWKLGYWPADKHSPEVREAIAKQCPDGPRYKALGNSWAVPVVRWIGQRIQQTRGGD